MEGVTLIGIAIIALVVLLCCTLGLFLYVCGITRTVIVGAGSPPIGQVKIAYKFAKGSYKDCSSLFHDAVKFGPVNCRTIGIYYDDPNVIPEEKCRYIVGAILGEGKVKVEQEVEDLMTSNDFNIITLPQVTNCVKTQFPFVNMLSIALVPWKVYPKMARYIKERSLCAYPMIEIYDEITINFMAPLSKQEDFYVPETKDHIPEEYTQQDVNMSSCDERSLLDHTRESEDRSSLESSLSTFSRSYVSSRYEGENTTDEEDSDGSSIQDDSVTSTGSVKLRPSSARTNLLKEDSESPEKMTFKEDGTIATETETSVSVTEDTMLLTDPQNTSVTQDDSVNLNDSGICSGRTSTSPTETESLTELTKDVVDPTADDSSSSSFEEIKMEHVSKDL